MVSLVNRRRGLVALVLLLFAASRTAAATQQSFPDDDERRLLAPGMVALFASPVLRVRPADRRCHAGPAGSRGGRGAAPQTVRVDPAAVERVPDEEEEEDVSSPHDAHELSDGFFDTSRSADAHTRALPARRASASWPPSLWRWATTWSASAVSISPTPHGSGRSYRRRRRTCPSQPSTWMCGRACTMAATRCTPRTSTPARPSPACCTCACRAPPAGLIFKDPRGFLPPFDLSSIRHTPVEGEVVLFPPWLPHAVAPARGDCRSPQHGRPREPRVSLSFNYNGVPYAPAEIDEFEDVRLVKAEATSSFHVPDVEKPATLEDVGQGKARHGKAREFARQGMATVCVSGSCDDSGLARAEAVENGRCPYVRNSAPHTHSYCAGHAATTTDLYSKTPTTSSTRQCTRSSTA